MQRKDIKRYIASFLITLFIFAVAIFLSSYISNSKVRELKRLQEELSQAVLSNDFSVVPAEDLQCQKILNQNYNLSGEISSLAEKITFTEEERGHDDKEVSSLREKYTLLLIKDYLTTSKLNSDCDLGLKFVLYFYSNEKCPQCEEQGYVLTALRNKDNLVRVYSFDSNSNLGSERVLMDKYSIKGPYPVLYIDGKVYNGFQSLEKLEEIVN